MASFVDSLVAPLSLVNALIVALGRRKNNDLSETFGILENIWDEYEVYEKVEDTSKRSPSYQNKGDIPLTSDIIVIGGGAAGMMAALTAADCGCSVLLLERNAKVGRKLYITGKGRCNVANDCTVPEVLQHVPRNPKFLMSAVTRFPPEAVKAFFEGLGVPLKTERGGRIFPQSDKAADIIDALFLALRRKRVDLVEDRATVLLTDESGRIAGVRESTELYRPCGHSGHRWGILSAHRLQRRRLPARGGGWTHHHPAQALSGAAGGRRERLCPDAGTLSAQRGGQSPQSEKEGGLCRTGRTSVYPLRPLRSADPQRQRTYEGV